MTAADILTQTLRAMVDAAVNGDSSARDALLDLSRERGADDKCVETIIRDIGFITAEDFGTDGFDWPCSRARILIQVRDGKIWIRPAGQIDDWVPDEDRWPWRRRS